ncbi:MAG: hypothetical protein ACK5MK_08305 [Dysgonomonas sp.]
MKKQRVITVISDLAGASDLPVVAKLAEDGWVVKQISTASFDAQKSKEMNFSKPSLAVTILFEKD